MVQICHPCSERSLNHGWHIWTPNGTNLEFLKNSLSTFCVGELVPVGDGGGERPPLVEVVAHYADGGDEYCAGERPCPWREIIYSDIYILICLNS